MSKMISTVKHREAIARVKDRESKPAKTLLRTAGMTALAALLGYAESKGALPTGFLKNDRGTPMIPTKVAIAFAAHGIAALSKGMVHEVSHAAGDTASITYGYAAGKAHAIVAG